MVFLYVTPAVAQQEYTPYDHLPGINKSYKPGYEKEFPEWAKKLYHYPVNFLEINSDFEDYMSLHPNEKSPVIRYFKIWRRVLEPYTSNDGTIHLPDLENYRIHLKNAQTDSGSRLNSSASVGSHWTFLGPKETFWLNESGSTTPPGNCPWQANVYSFDVANSDNRVLYCGTETGFVNKTTNKGINWQLLAPAYPFGGSIKAVAIHPQNPDIVYVTAGKQVHLTLDGGISWKPLLPSDNLFSADRLKIDPANPSKLFAVANEGVFVSSDGGASWSRKWPLRAYDVEIKPQNSRVCYAITRTSAGMFSIIASTDEGNSFSAISSFPGSFADSGGGLIAVSEADPDALWGVLLSADKTPYILKGNFSVSSWTWSTLATGKTTSLLMDNGQGYFDLALEVSPLNANIVLVGTTTLYKSVNGGKNYTAVGGYSGGFSIHPDIQDMKMLPSGETWVSTDGGMTLTTDNFTSLSNCYFRINGLIGSDMWGFDQGWNEDLVVGGRYHNGNTAISGFYQGKALRMGGAEAPTGWVLQGRSRHVAFSDLGNGWILPETAEGKPVGRFIFSKYPNMDEYGGRRSNIVHHPNYYGTLYVGEGTGFWMSTDMGVNYDLLYNFPGKVRYFQQSVSNPDVFYADILDYGLYQSTDGGRSWNRKTALTDGTYNTSYWSGKLFIAISPYNENHVYACLQNGTWSADAGAVFRSEDGGTTWTNWSGTLSELTKCLVIQPSEGGKDLVYLFTSSRNGRPARVFYRQAGMDNWADFGNNYPAGFDVNLALPFFRDGKIRVGGSGGVWESPLLEPDFIPVINPWCEKQNYGCILDTIYFDDHSMLNHQGAEWEWTITPRPAYVSNTGTRNPKVVPGKTGTFSVTMKLTKNGKVFSKTIENMVSVKNCPSVDDCSNPAELAKKSWSLHYYDSQESNYPGFAAMAFDGDPNTIWHTRWSNGTDAYPHELQVDMGAVYNIYRFTYLPRQEGTNGRIKNYELYLSENSTNWGTAVKSGEFKNSSAPETFVFGLPVKARYFRLKSLSEVNGNPWASVAELSAVGCKSYPTSAINLDLFNDLKASPIPATDWVTISLPGGDEFTYFLYDALGQLIENRKQNPGGKELRLNLTGLSPGNYFVRLVNDQGNVFRVKLLRQ